MIISFRKAVDWFGVAFKGANGTADAQRHLIESDHGDPRCTQAPPHRNQHGGALHRPDENDELSRLLTIDCLRREGRPAVSYIHGEESIASFQLDEHAIARLEAGLRAQEATLRLPHAGQLPPVIGLPPVDDGIDDCHAETPFDPSPPPSSE
jgi:hypothetical protein